VTKWDDIPALYKTIATVVVATVFVLTYHDQFVTLAEAMEQQTKASHQLIKLRVDNKETEKRTLIREKKKATRDGDMTEVAVLNEDIQTLRDQIKSLCDQIDDC
jgi:hypothetical protein